MSGSRLADCVSAFAELEDEITAAEKRGNCYRARALALLKLAREYWHGHYRLADAWAAEHARAERLADALRKYPHNPDANTWTQAHVNWYWEVCRPLLDAALAQQPPPTGGHGAGVSGDEGGRYVRRDK